LIENDCNRQLEEIEKKRREVERSDLRMLMFWEEFWGRSDVGDVVDVVRRV
jgi:hypothetical protein